MAKVEENSNHEPEDKMEKITVVVRVRPMHKEEATQRSPWKLSSKSIASSKTCRPPIPCHCFTFDKVYGMKANTLEIYEAYVKDIIDSTVSGVNGTIIAYGQSGSGKTSTMRGLPNQSGILVLAVQDVFKRVQEEVNKEFLVRVSYFEVANEELVDLLGSKNQRLHVHEDAQGEIVVVGLREEIVDRAEQVLSLLEFADARSFVCPTSTSKNRRRPHSIFRMVIESRVETQENLLIPPQTDTVQVSVLNLVEVSAANSGTVENEETKPDRSLITLGTVMSKLSEGAEKQGEKPKTMRRSKSVITQGQMSATKTISSSAETHCPTPRVQVDGTVQTLMFAAKATRVMNCFKADEVDNTYALMEKDLTDIWRDKAVLKHHRRGIEELRNKLKEEHSETVEEIVNHQNALLMIELEREQMSMELLGKAPLVCWSEKKAPNQEQSGENITSEGEFGADQGIEMGDFKSPSQKRTLYESFEELNQFQWLQNVDHRSRKDSGGFWIGPHVGSKRKRTSSPDLVAEKFEQVDLLFQSKMARKMKCIKAEGIAERQQLTELRALIAQQDKEQEELLARKDEECRNLQQQIAQLEEEKVTMEKRLQEQESSYSEAVGSLKGQLAVEKARQVHGDCQVEVVETILPVEKVGKWSRNDADLNTAANLQGELQARGVDFLGSWVNQHTEAALSCISQESKEQQNVLKEIEGQQHTSTKRRSGHHFKAHKVCQKLQAFQGRSEVSNLRKELAVAMETIAALKDERDDLWKDLKQIKVESEKNLINMSTKEEEQKAGDKKALQLLAAAIDELKAELDSATCIADALLEVVSESFQMLTTDLKSFQEGVAELKALSCAAADLSESLEKAKLQLTVLRHGKLTSEKELHSMKSELAKLECVVERQSGVLKVLSDNESLLSELSSARAAMKEAAGASEARLLSIQEEYNGKLEKLEYECEKWKQEHGQMEEKYTDIQLKLECAQAEVQTLTQAVAGKSELEKKQQSDIQLKIDAAENEVLKLTQALEKEKANMDKQQKHSNSRQATTEAEILRLSNSLGEKGGLQEEIEKLQAELAASQTEVAKLERKVKEADEAHQQVLVKLASKEDVVARLTAAWEEKVRVEAGQQHKVACSTVNEALKVSKVLEDTLLQVEAQKRELILSRAKVEKLGRELEEKNTLEDNYSKTLDRLVGSETEVARLTKIITSQLEDKSILEQDHTNFLYKLESSETEVARVTASLTTLLQEKENLQKELKKVLLELSKSSENLSREEGKRKLLEENQQVNLDKLVKEQEQRKLLEESIVELLHKLTKEQEELKLLKETHEQLLGEHSRGQEGRNNPLKKSSNDEALLRPSSRMQEEEEAPEKKHQDILTKLAISEIEVSQAAEAHQELVNRLAKEHEDRITLGTITHETLEELVMEKMEKTHQDIVDKLAQTELEVAHLTTTLTTQQQEKNRVDMEHQQLLDNLKRQQEQRSALEKENQETLDRLVREQEEREQLEKTHQKIVNSLAASEAEVARLTETLTTKMQEQQEVIDNLTRQQEERSILEKKEQENVLKEREQLEKTHQSVLQKLVTSQSEVAQLTENLNIEMQENNRLEREHLDILNKLAREQEERNVLENNCKEGQEEKNLLEKDNKTCLQELAQLTETLTRALEDNCRLEKAHQEFYINSTRDQEEKRALERSHQETLEKLASEQQEGRRQLLEKAHDTTQQVAKLTETLAKELQEKDRLEKEVQEIHYNLNREQAERKVLETKNREILNTLTRAVIEREALEETYQNLLEKLAIAEAEVDLLTGTLTAEPEKENMPQESLQQHTTALEEKVRNSKESHEKLTRKEEEAELLEKNYQKLEGKVAELSESLASEVQKKNRLELQYSEILKTSEYMNSEVSRLTESLSRELESRKSLEKTHTALVAQLASSNDEVARLSANLSEEAAEKGNLTTNHVKILAELAASKMEVEHLNKTQEETQQNLRHKLADSEAELLRQKDEGKEVHRLLQLELDATKSQVQSLSSQKEKLQQDGAELLARISSLETELLRLNKELGTKLGLEEEVNKLKSEVSTLTSALGGKSRLEEEQRKVQQEVLSQQGEISKLTKQLRVNRKVVKDQTKLIHNLTSNQAEVLRLTSALGGRSQSSKAQVQVHEQSTSTDPTVTGYPCEKCGLQALNEEHIQLRQKLASKEAEVATFRGIITEEKVVLEQKWASAQLELSAAQAEIERLTAEVVTFRGITEEKLVLEKKWASAQLELSAAQAEIERLTAALQDKLRLDEHVSQFQMKLSEAGLLRCRKETNGCFQSSLEELPTQLLELERELQSRAGELAEKERSLRDKEIGTDVDYEALNTIITLREKERDVLRDQCTVAESRLCNLSSFDAEKQRELETAEKKLKSKCHKAEKDAADLRAKLEKLEEATGWLVRDKNLLEERLACCEAQLNSVREASRSTNKELELSHHQLHVLTAQHQSEIAALCEELSMKKAQNAELEADLNRLLGGHPLQPVPPPQEAPGFLPNHLLRLPPPWAFPRGPGHHH